MLPDPDAFAAIVASAIQLGLAPLQARTKALEAKQSQPGRDGRDGAPGLPGVGVKGDPGERGERGADGLIGLTGSPGLQGLTGEPGADGLHGKDGTLEQLKALYDGERTLTLCFKDGTPIEGGGLTLPIVLDRGVYRPDATYVKGDAVTYGGSVHIAQMTTTAKPEDGSGAWRLAVKHGREGKPGLNGKDGIHGRDLTKEIR